MPNQFADLSPIMPPFSRIDPAKLGNPIRYFESTITIAAGPPGVGERIVWGKLPVGARPIGHLGLLSWSGGAASSTLTVGDNVNTARHLAATAVTAAGTAVPSAAAANGGTFRTSDDSSAIQPGNWISSATDNCTLVSVVGGAALQVGQVITLRMPYTDR